MTIKTLQQRAEIEAAIEGRTLCDQLQVTAERSGDAPALSDAGQSGTQTITWAQAREQALRLADRIEGRTRCDHLQVTAERSGDAPALSDAGQSGTQTITWAQAREQALRL